jgi:hypothetical protein
VQTLKECVDQVTNCFLNVCISIYRVIKKKIMSATSSFVLLKSSC